MLKKWIALSATVAILVTGCYSSVYNQTEANVADVKIKTEEAIHRSNKSAVPPPALLVHQGPYVDQSPISLERQPSWLSNHIVLRGNQLPFSYYSHVIASGSPIMVLTKYQAGLDDTVSLGMNYTGSIKGALDLLATRAGYAYHIHGNTIYWEAFITKTFEIAFMPGGTSYMMGDGGASGSGDSSGGSAGGIAGSTDSSSAGATGGNNSSVTATPSYTTGGASSEYSNLTASLSVWKDVQTSIQQMLSPKGTVTVSQSTTSVTVRDRPTNVNLVAQYIRNLNQSLSKQVLVKVQILEVTLENDYNMGIDWQIIANAFHNSPFVINGNYGTPISISQVLSAQSPIGAGATPTYPQFGTQAQNSGIPSWTILLNALSQQGKTSIVTEPRVVCLNNQVSVIRITDSTGYVASVQNTTLAGSTGSSGNSVTSQITPGNVITGLTLYILPKILNNRIYIQVNADMSSNQGIKTFTTGSGSNTQSVQLPNVSEKHFNQRSVIKSGDTLILSGYKQTSNSANANQFLQSQALGGKGSQQINKETIILITPIILHGTI